MQTITKTEPIKDKLISAFNAVKSNLYGDAAARLEAISSFDKLGIPNRKNEEYKYVNVELILKDNFGLQPTQTLTAEQIKSTKFLEQATVIVIENGFFSKQLSSLATLPKGLRVVNIQEAGNDNAFLNAYSKLADIHSDAFIALNTAMTNGGVYIHVADNAIIEAPIHIIQLSSATSNTIIQPRVFIHVGKNAQANVVQSFESVNTTAKTFNNTVTEIVIDEQAIVNHYQIENEGTYGHLVNTTQTYQKSKSVFSTYVFTLSGSFVRNNLNMVLDDERIESHLYGLYLTNDHQVLDNHTLVDHRKPNCNSNELYKGIIEEKSSATFNGKIFVRKDAQQTNAFQSNKNILLSDDGTINTKPQLEIYANDVKCSHGTSTGKLDEDKIFYLRARGLSETSAKKMLMHAFASEVVENVTLESLRKYIEEKISKRFE
ncbi:MAG TPA: Fe-S cluster assembly protein SufD [Bacteroidia bacterium]|jgi:Fe-S cluster assembly protein SufD|nr:Fe-S cluster assembly protein SufD [Bacteroidia bacterium]